MIQRISGVIAAATAIKQFQKKDGTLSDQATLHIQQVTNDVYPQEVAVKVTGELAQFARMVGYNVEVDYVVRVFNFSKQGEQMIGNDIYARSIKVAGATTQPQVAVPTAPQPVAGYLPAPPLPVGYLPAPTPVLALPAPQPVLALPAPQQPAGLLPAPASQVTNGQTDGDMPF